MADDILLIVGKNIRDRRNKLGLSQEALAELCGLHRTYIGSVERGERNISIVNLSRIASSLRCKATELLQSG